VNILYSLDSSTDLDVYIATVLPQEVRVIRDHLAVIIDNLLPRASWPSDRKRITVISPAVLRVVVFVDHYSRAERL
jgi:hypothetical protein